ARSRPGSSTTVSRRGSGHRARALAIKGGAGRLNEDSRTSHLAAALRERLRSQLTVRRLAPIIAAGCAGALLTLPVQSVREHWRDSTGGQSSQSSQFSDVVLATVDGQHITLQDFQREMARRGGAMSKFGSMAQRRALLDDMIRLQVLAANARRLGYDRDAEITATVQRLLAGKYRESWLDTQLSEATVSDGEVEAYYRDHLAEFTQPES